MESLDVKVYKATMSNKTKALKVIESFELGKDLKQSFIDCGISGYLFRKTIHTYQDLSERLAQARMMLSDIMVSEMIRISDDETIDTLQAKTMIETRRWIAGKYMPKVYGDRLDLNITETVDLRQALDTAKGRVIQSKAIKVIQDVVGSTEDTDKQGVS